MDNIFPLDLVIRATSDKTLAQYSYIGIGAPVKYLFAPKSLEDLSKIIRFSIGAELEILPIGACSNILFGNLKDTVVISDEKLPFFWEQNGNEIVVSSNYPLGKFLNQSAETGLGGLEFLAGLPAHIGGSVHMNAGAFNNNISDLLEWIEVMDKDGKLQRVNKKDIDFSYRKISIDDFIFRCCFRLVPADEKLIRKKINDFIQLRAERHPLDYPSLGSTFKNPPQKVAGILIRDCGLAGRQIGGAQISQKHSNFILNVDKAKFSDYYELIKLAENEVRSKFNIQLELENKVIL